MKKHFLVFSIACVLISSFAIADDSVPHKFEKGIAPKAEQFNENFETLAKAISNIEKRMHATVGGEKLPKGIILAWYAQSGKVPSGWAICDGTNGTPDLRDKFLRGVATFADVGIDNNAKSSHSHSATGSISGETSSARNSKSDGWKTIDDRKKAPQATGIDHTHKFSGSVISKTSEASHIPPNARVLYIMKIQ